MLHQEEIPKICPVPSRALKINNSRFLVCHPEIGSGKKIANERKVIPDPIDDKEESNKPMTDDRSTVVDEC